MDDTNIREIRISPIVPTRSVLIATARGKRPLKRDAFTNKDTRHYIDTCPFCRGNEHMTPATVFQDPVAGEWQIRIIKNLYPILDDDRFSTPSEFEVQHIIEGYGHHEVIIDHADHGVALHQMTESHLANLFGLYQDRMQVFYETDPRIKYVLTFKNFGPAAGASIPHTHSQMIAMPITPHNILDEIKYSRDYFNKNGHCVFCGMMNETTHMNNVVYPRGSGKELRQFEVDRYIVEKSNHFIAIKPFASFYEWEIHILPLEHQSDFLKTGKEKLIDLARVLKRTMARLDAVVGNVQYNYFIHSIPRSKGIQENEASYHWHLEICPRTSIPSGFELGSGLFVNTISPEEAAMKLRLAEI